jgi:DNA-binding MarR family transcriptional regulator
MMSLVHAAHLLEDKLEAALGRASLSMPKFSVLSELVGAGNPLSLGELASRLSCVRSNMTQLVDRLEADGLVRRVSCPEDRRSVKAEITAEGARRQAAGASEVAKVEQEFRESISAVDRAAMDRMLAGLK